jgi:hypothetical protein
VSYGLPGRVDVGGSATARDIIIATGSVPFVPGGIEVDGKTVFTSDHALKMEWLPSWVAIIGSGYIGLEFSDVYTALGCEVGGAGGGGGPGVHASPVRHATRPAGCRLPASRLRSCSQKRGAGRCARGGEPG